MQQPNFIIRHHGARTQTQPSRPTPLRVSIDPIPHQLRTLKQWVAWYYRYEPLRTGEKTWQTVLIDPHTGKFASTKKPETWGTLDAAHQHYQRSQDDGISFVLTPQIGLVGVALDHCRDPDSRDIAPWAQAIVDRLRTYVEVSPLGTGLRVWLEGTKPPNGRKKGDIEMYDRTYIDRRYVTVTGHHLAGTPPTIEPRQDALEAFHAEVFGVRASPERPAASRPGNS
jgi:putative DNA primase/helicase